MKFITKNNLEQNLREFFNTIDKPYIEKKINSIKKEDDSSKIFYKLLKENKWNL